MSEMAIWVCAFTQAGSPRSLRHDAFPLNAGRRAGRGQQRGMGEGGGVKREAEGAGRQTELG